MVENELVESVDSPERYPASTCSSFLLDETSNSYTTAETFGANSACAEPEAPEADNARTDLAVLDAGSEVLGSWEALRHGIMEFKVSSGEIATSDYAESFLCECTKSFWRQANFFEMGQWMQTRLLEFWVSGIFEEYLGTPGELLPTASPWPAFWRLPEEEAPEPPEAVYFSYRKKILFTEEVNLKTAELPRWKPRALIDT